MATDPLPSKELTYLEWRLRDDPHQEQPWALYIVTGGNDAWHLLNAPAPLEVRGASNEPCEGVKCVHCNGSGDETQHYDEQNGWSEEKSCDTCKGSGRITTVEQYLKTLPANWHENSSLETWFPITAEELQRLKEDLHRTESARVAILAENTHYKRERDAYRALAGIGFSGTDEADELAKIEPAWERDAEAMRRRQERGLATMKAVADAVRAAQPPGAGQ